jgi:hypothetical protein
MIMSDSETLKTSDDGRFRVQLIADEYPDEPYDDGQSPLLRIGHGYNGARAEHVMATGRPLDNDSRIEEAAERWGGPDDDDWRLFEKYLHAYYGVTKIETWHSGEYWYVTYDPAGWREHVGAPEGSISMAEYRAWCEGDVWMYAVERKVTWKPVDAPADDDVTMTTWETVDSCGGYYGRDYAEECALEAFKSETESSLTPAPLGLTQAQLDAALADMQRVAALPPAREIAEREE